MNYNLNSLLNRLKAALPSILKPFFAFLNPLFYIRTLLEAGFPQLKELFVFCYRLPLLVFPFINVFFFIYKLLSQAQQKRQKTIKLVFKIQLPQLCRD